VGESFDTGSWADQTLWWSERQRSRGLVWPGGESWFANDPLGPMPHTHPDASEVYFVSHGRLRVTVGSTELEMARGDYILIPPDTYHHPINLWENDLCLFVVVAPNWRDRRWKTSGFTEDDYKGSADVVGTDAPGPLPSDEHIEAAVVSVEGVGEAAAESRAESDRALYILEGRAELAVEHLSGILDAHRYVHVMAGASHSIANCGPGPLRYMSIWTPSARGDA
jgi:mannose-6-phosphate isomerase-like protein (cupin superfamily)